MYRKVRRIKIMVDIVDENDVRRRYRRRKRCDICGRKIKNKYYDILDDYGNPTGRVYCPRADCMAKASSDWRTGNLDPSSAPGRGFIGAQIVAKTLGVDDCGIKMNNFCFYIDLSKHTIYGYSEVKARTLDKKRGKWNVSDTYRELNDITYDTLFVVCMDEYWPWKNVRRVYAIPWEVISHKTGFDIYQDPPKRADPWYEEFRIDEKPFNDTYHNMKLSDCPILNKNKLYRNIKDKS